MVISIGGCKPNSMDNPSNKLCYVTLQKQLLDDSFIVKNNTFHHPSYFILGDRLLSKSPLKQISWTFRGTWASIMIYLEALQFGLLFFIHSRGENPY